MWRKLKLSSAFKENLEKNIFAISGIISTAVFWAGAFRGTASDICLGLLVFHSLVCFLLAYLRKAGKYKNLKDISLKRIEIGGAGIALEMERGDEKPDGETTISTL